MMKHFIPLMSTALEKTRDTYKNEQMKRCVSDGKKKQTDQLGCDGIALIELPDLLAKHQTIKVLVCSNSLAKLIHTSS